MSKEMHHWIASAIESDGKLSVDYSDGEYTATMRWATCEDVVSGESAGTLFGSMAALEDALHTDAELEMINSGMV